MKGKLPLKALDIVIILLSLGLTGFSAFSVYVKPQNTTRVLVDGPVRRWVYPLNAEETIHVEGPLGVTVVRIGNNEAWVESSPCDNQICVASGRIHTNGFWVACLPNQVSLLIEGIDEPGNDLDGLAR